MKNQQKRQWALSVVFLSTLIELLSFGAPGSVFALRRLSGCCLSELRVYRAFAVREWNRMLRIRVGKSVPKSAIPSSMMKRILFVLAVLTTMPWLTALEPFLQPNQTDIDDEGAYRFSSPYNDTTLVEQTYGVGYGADIMPGRSNSTWITSPTGIKLLSPHIVQPKPNPLDSTMPMIIDISVLQIIELVTEMVDRLSSLAPEVLSPISSTNDAGNRSRQTLTVSVPPRPLETYSPTSLELPPTATAIIDGIPPDESHEQSMITTILADPLSTPQQPYATATHPVSQLPAGGVSIRSSGSMSAPPSMQTSQVTDRSRMEPFEDVQRENYLPSLECPHMSDPMELNISNTAGNSSITGTLSMSGEFSRYTPTLALPSETPGTSPEPSPGYNSNQQYRPRFQPLSPPVERSVQAEQPWSPENSISTSARQDRINKLISKCDDLLQTRSGS